MNNYGVWRTAEGSKVVVDPRVEAGVRFESILVSLKMG